MSTHPASHSAGKLAAHASNVVLVLDTDGRIQVASAAACTLWGANHAELVGDVFPNLFIFEVVSGESGWVQSQWEVLLAAAQSHPITLRLQPKEAAAFDVNVRLEKAGDAWEGATEGVRHAASTVSEYACDAWDDAVGFMRRYPGATLCAGLGVGFLLGCVLRNSLPGLSDGGRMTTRMSSASQGHGGPEYSPPTGSY